MNNVVDEVLASNPRYDIKDNGGTTLYSDVQIDLATEIITEGTPLNKALFDSIKDDLNSRLLISSKATQAQAVAGTNDTNYMTPLKVKQAIDSKKSALDGEFDTGTLTSTSQTFSFSMSVKTRFIMFCFGYDRVSSSFKNIYEGCTALFDCKNNKFLFGLSDANFFTFNSLPYFSATYEHYSVKGEITSCTYSSGTLSFSLKSTLGGSSITNALKMGIKVIELDGLPI